MLPRLMIHMLMSVFCVLKIRLKIGGNSALVVGYSTQIKNTFLNYYLQLVAVEVTPKTLFFSRSSKLLRDTKLCNFNGKLQWHKGSNIHNKMVKCLQIVQKLTSVYKQKENPRTLCLFSSSTCQFSYFNQIFHSCPTP